MCMRMALLAWPHRQDCSTLPIPAGHWTIARAWAFGECDARFPTVGPALANIERRAGFRGVSAALVLPNTNANPRPIFGLNTKDMLSSRSECSLTDGGRAAKWRQLGCGGGTVR